MLTAGIFGKLPAHGDFVARGWDAETVAALDGWLTGGLAAARANRDDDVFAGFLTAAPLWFGYLPPGWAGPAALFIVLTPSIDRAGRYFMIAAGVAGSAAAVWAAGLACADFGVAIEAAVHAALGGDGDADGLTDRIAAAAPALDARTRLLAEAALPSSAVWWCEPAAGDPLALRGGAADAALLERLLAGGAA